MKVAAFNLRRLAFKLRWSARSRKWLLPVSTKLRVAWCWDFFKESGREEKKKNKDIAPVAAFAESNLGSIRQLADVCVWIAPSLETNELLKLGFSPQMLAEVRKGVDRGAAPKQNTHLPSRPPVKHQLLEGLRKCRPSYHSSGGWVKDVAKTAQHFKLR
ncbi:MAG: hypothetical protein ACKERG_04695 [Candidatus Hodgkinia cicadicola]